MSPQFPHTCAGGFGGDAKRPGRQRQQIVTRQLFKPPFVGGPFRFHTGNIVFRQPSHGSSLGWRECGKHTLCEQGKAASWETVEA